MTANELRAQFGVVYKIIQRERRWREHVFPPGHPKREEKLGEMDRLLEITTAWKEVLKVHIGDGFEQPTLLDVPRKPEYK